MDKKNLQKRAYLNSILKVLECLIQSFLALDRAKISHDTRGQKVLPDGSFEKPPKMAKVPNRNF